MAVIRPFYALRPAVDSVKRVVSVPYDVVNTKEARALAAEEPLSFLRITRSEVELPDSADPYTPEVYSLAKANLGRIRTEAPLVLDEMPSLYLYELTMDGRKQIGLAGCFSVDDYDNDIILKHEKTRKVKEDDRTNHIVTTEAQTGIVFLTYRGVDSVNALITKITANSKPLYEVLPEDGILHRVWQVPTIDVPAIVEAIGGVDKLYIADGHHRAKSASRARDAKRSMNPDHTGAEEYNYFIAVLFPADQLYIMPYNRVIQDLNGHTKESFLEKVQGSFSIQKNGVATPEKARVYSMYLDGEWYQLSLKPEYYEGETVIGAKSFGDSLDVSVLQNYLLDPVLGIEDQRTSKRIDFIGGIRGTKELERLVNSGSFAVAFSMYPVTLNDLMSISDAGEVMPPKSTWFEPKLRDGFLVHLI